MNIAHFLFFIKLSFHSSKFYQNCFSIKPAYKAMLLLIVIAMVSIPSACYWFNKVASIDQLNTEDGSENDDEHNKLSESNLVIKEIINQLPKITLNNGVAAIEGASEQSMIIKHPVTSEPVIVINIDNKADPVLLKKTLIIINKREVIFQFFNNKSPKIYKFNEIIPQKNQNNIVIDRSTVQKLILDARKNLLITIPLVFYPISCMIGFMVIMFRSLVFSAAGLLLPRFTKGLPFTAILQQAMLAAIPAAIIEMFLSLVLGEIGVSAGVIQFLNMSIATGYFIFAVKSYDLSIDTVRTS